MTQDIEELENRVEDFCELRDWDQYHNPKDLAIGVSTEASELLEHFRFKSPQEAEELLNTTEEREEIEEEMADVLFFLLRMAGKYDIDLVEVFERKMAKNSERYPVEKAKGSNEKYTKWEDE
jgi:NTP pyrophosphatase (non-canonical NTP hydrolase)